jgi:hypothetical protein
LLKVLEAPKGGFPTEGPEQVKKEQQAVVGLKHLGEAGLDSAKCWGLPIDFVDRLPGTDLGIPTKEDNHS